MSNQKIDALTRRWGEQRWQLDAFVRSHGVEVAPRAAAGGLDGMGDFQAAARRIRRFEDMDREFAKQARKRMARAEACEKEERFESARESYFIAALLWSAAQWPLFEINDDAPAYEAEMNRAFEKVVRYMDRPIERADIPFAGKALPAYLHLPRAPKEGERFPAVLSIGGLDGSKENMVSLYGDRYLQRGIAVLALDGPGQGEAASRGIFMTDANFGDAAVAAIDWLERHPAIDSGRIAVRGNSFGSYFGTVAASRLGTRILAFAAAGICQEPGMDSICNHANPWYKVRMMFMSGFDDEGAFDRFIAAFDLRRFAADIKAPYMILAGEDDALSPITCTYELFEHITAPKRLVVYEGSNHGIRDGGSAQEGEEKTTVVSDWLKARLQGKPFQSELVRVDSAGRTKSSPFPN
jgi:pimeloyl-ACP methyl ester carboxylesterase